MKRILSRSEFVRTLLIARQAMVAWKRHIVAVKGPVAMAKTARKLRSRTAWILGWCLVLGLPLAGCGKRSTDATSEQLIRNLKSRERSELVVPKTLDERIAAARGYLDDDNVVSAQQELRTLLISDAEHRDVLRLSAECQAMLGDRAAAVATLELIDDSDLESHREANWLAAQWLIEMHQYDAAQLKLERLLELPGDATRVHRKLALILNNQGRRIEAAPHLLALAKLGEVREKELFAMTTYSHPFIDDSMPKPDFGGALLPALLAEARLLRANGELHQAVELVERLRDAYPAATQISAFQGRLYADLQDEQRLARWVLSLPEGIEREPEYWCSLGLMLQRQDRHREAVRALAEAIRRDQTDGNAYEALGYSLEFLGQHQAAERVAERVSLLREASGLAKQFGLARGTAREINRMAEILWELKRPWEAISWREIALGNSAADDQQRRELSELRESMSGDDGRASDEFLACGLDLSQWPLPAIDDLGSLSHDVSQDPAPSSQSTPIGFDEVADSAGLHFRYDNGDDDPSDHSSYIHQLTGGGIGVIDFNLDGWFDVYLAQGGGDAFDPSGSQPNQLFANGAGRPFINVTDAAQTGDRGYGQGVAVADLNQDGFSDIVLANIGVNVLYLNNGDGSFTRRELPAGNGGGWTTSIACGDLSGDHLPEVVEVNYIDDPTALTRRCESGTSNCSPRVFQPAADQVWQVQADGSLSLWEGCREISGKASFGFAAVLANFDGNPGNELFIANDTRQNQYWISRSDGDTDDRVLEESAGVYGCGSGSDGLPRGCMGIAQGDFDRNGRLDLHVTNFWNEASDIYLQRSTGLFVPANVMLNVFKDSRKTVGWGTQAIDFDRDGWLDLAVLNGHVVEDLEQRQPFEMLPQLFQGHADGFQIVDRKSEVGPYWSQPKLGRVMAVMDWNRDSRPDLIANHLDAPLALLENRTAGGNSVQFELVGTLSERDATGAVVTVHCGDQTWTGWDSGSGGFLCSNERVLDFGIAASARVDRVDVLWPTGVTQQFTDLAVNQRYLIVEGAADAFVRQ